MCKFPEVLSDTCKGFFFIYICENKVQRSKPVLSLFSLVAVPPGCLRCPCLISRLLSPGAGYQSWDFHLGHGFKSDAMFLLAVAGKIIL